MIPTVTIKSGLFSTPVQNPADLNAVFEAAGQLSLDTGSPADIVGSDGDYFTTRPSYVPNRGIRFHGSGRGCKFHNRCTQPVKLLAPGFDGYPGTRAVETGVLGIYLVSRGEDTSNEIVLENFRDMGLLETPATANRHWTGLRVLGNNVTIRNVFGEQETSTAINQTQKSKYASLQARTVATYAALGVGQDRWEEPDPRRVRAVSQCTIENVCPMGEPLEESGEGDRRYFGIHLRRVVNLKIDGVTLSDLVNRGDRLVSDLLITSVPNHGDTFFVNDWDPFQQRFSSVTYTWKKWQIAAFSGAPTSGKIVTFTTKGSLGVKTVKVVYKTGGGTDTPLFKFINVSGLTAAQSAQQLASVANTALGGTPITYDGGGATNVYTDDVRVTMTTDASEITITTANATTDVPRGTTVGQAGDFAASTIFGNCVNQGGTRFSEAQSTLQYLGVASLGAVRIRQALIEVKTANLKTTGFVPYEAGGTAATAAFVTIGTGSYGSVRVMNNGKRRTGYSRASVWMEDCFAKTVKGLKPGFHKVKSFIVDLATMQHNDFGPVETSEAGGHSHYMDCIGDGISAQEAVFDIQGAGFVELSAGINPGQVGGDGNSIQAPPFVRVKPGNFRSWLIDLATGNAANNDTFEVEDTAGNVLQFVIKNSGGYSAANPLHILLGADAATTMRNIRIRVRARLDAHALQAYTSDPFDNGGGTFRSRITFFSETPEHAVLWPRLRKVSGCANFTFTKSHEFYRPSFVTAELNPHWVQAGVDSTAPTIELDRVYAGAEIRCAFEHTKAMSGTGILQEFWTALYTGANFPDGAIVNIRPTAGGTYRVFRFKNTPTNNADPNFDVQIGASFAESLYNLHDRINQQPTAGAYASVAGAAFSILKAHPEVDSAFITTSNFSGSPELSFLRLIPRKHVKATGVPVDNAKITVTSSSGSLSGVAQDFVFKAGGGTDLTPANTLYVDTTIYNMAEKAMSQLAAKIASRFGTSGGENCGVWNGGGICFIRDIGQSLTVTKAGDTNSDLTIVDLVPITIQGGHWPIVCRDVTWFDVIGRRGSPLTTSAYGSGIFGEQYQSIGAIETGFGALPMQLLYAEKGLSSLVSLSAALTSTSQITVTLGDGSIAKLIFQAGGGTDAANKWFINISTATTTTAQMLAAAEKLNYALGRPQANPSGATMNIGNLDPGATVVDTAGSGDPDGRITITNTVNRSKGSIVGARLEGITEPQYASTYVPVLTSPWGAGRTTAAKLYDLGPNMPASGTPPTCTDILTPANQNIVNGALL